jgi:hypothetical protein
MTERTETPTLSSRIEHQFLHIIENPAFYGLPKVFSVFFLSKHTLPKLLLLAAVLCCFSYCAFYITKCVVTFYKYEVVTTYETIYENQPLFPRVRIAGHEVC